MFFGLVNTQMIEHRFKRLKYDREREIILIILINICPKYSEIMSSVLQVLYHKGQLVYGQKNEVMWYIIPGQQDLNRKLHQWGQRSNTQPRNDRIYIASVDSPISISLHILQVPTYEVSVWFFVNRFSLPCDSIIFSIA